MHARVLDRQILARLQRTEKQLDLTECINQMVLESQLPHKIVNLLFIITNKNSKLTVLWGSSR